MATPTSESTGAPGGIPIRRRCVVCHCSHPRRNVSGETVRRKKECTAHKKQNDHRDTLASDYGRTENATMLAVSTVWHHARTRTTACVVQSRAASGRTRDLSADSWSTATFQSAHCSAASTIWKQNESTRTFGVAPIVQPRGRKEQRAYVREELQCTDG